MTDKRQLVNFNAPACFIYLFFFPVERHCQGASSPWMGVIHWWGPALLNLQSHHQSLEIHFPIPGHSARDQRRSHISEFDDINLTNKETQLSYMQFTDTNDFQITSIFVLWTANQFVHLTHLFSGEYNRGGRAGTEACAVLQSSSFCCLALVRRCRNCHSLSCHHHVILCQRCSCTVLSQHRSEAGSSRAVSTLGRCSCLLQWSWTGALGTRKAPETFRLQAFRAQLTASRAPAFLSLRRPRTQFVHDMIPSLLRLMIMFSLTNWAFVWARWLPYLY